MYTTLKNIISSITQLDENDWQTIESQLNIKKIQKNEYYLKAGEVETQLGFIASGSFRWFYINDKGEELNFHFSFENSFVVEYQSFISQEPSVLYIQAMEDSTIITMPKRDKIFEMYNKSHSWSELGRKIAQAVYVKTANRIHELLFNSAEERYRNLIKQHPDIFQRVSLTNIASYIGIKAPSLSRIRKRISLE